MTITTTVSSLANGDYYKKRQIIREPSSHIITEIVLNNVIRHWYSFIGLRFLALYYRLINEIE